MGSDRANYDYVIVGGGIVGLSIARELQRRSMGRILVLEKEPQLGLHSSGRNSGVLHSGIYYPTGTLKAKLCVRGAQLLRSYIEERRLKHLKCGKVIVAQRPELVEQIPLLLERAKANGVECRLVDAAELKRLEPLAHSYGSALHSPHTWVFDPIEALQQLHRELQEAGVTLHLEQAYEEFKPRTGQVLTRSGQEFQCGFLINAAGLWADQVAHPQGAGNDYQILPFRGTYRELKEPKASQLKGMIYPVPDLELPFLGVHLTRSVHGYVTVGPTAMPALGRENYKWLGGFNPSVAMDILSQLTSMAISNRNKMRNHMLEEIRLHWPAHFQARLKDLAPDVSVRDLQTSKKRGLRAQLVNIRTGKLEMDFLLEKSERALHVLNAVSPAFSSAFAFAEHVCDQVSAS